MPTLQSTHTDTRTNSNDCIFVSRIQIWIRKNCPKGKHNFEWNAKKGKENETKICFWSALARTWCDQWKMVWNRTTAITIITTTATGFFCFCREYFKHRLFDYYVVWVLVSMSEWVCVCCVYMFIFSTYLHHRTMCNVLASVTENEWGWATTMRLLLYRIYSQAERREREQDSERGMQSAARARENENGAEWFIQCEWCGWLLQSMQTIVQRPKGSTFSPPNNIIISLYHRVHTRLLYLCAVGYIKWQAISTHKYILIPSSFIHSYSSLFLYIFIALVSALVMERWRATRTTTKGLNVWISLSSKSTKKRNKKWEIQEECLIGFSVGILFKLKSCAQHSNHITLVHVQNIKFSLVGGWRKRCSREPETTLQEGDDLKIVGSTDCNVCDFGWDSSVCFRFCHFFIFSLAPTESSTKIYQHKDRA